MQALIDFDGWRKWKDFSSPTNNGAKTVKDGKKKGGKTDAPAVGPVDGVVSPNGGS